MRIPALLRGPAEQEGGRMRGKPGRGLCVGGEVAGVPARIRVL